MSLQQEIRELIDCLIEQIEDEDHLSICDDCSICDATVRRQKNKSDQQITTHQNDRDLFLCSNCSTKRKKEAEKVLKDLENLAVEVEERLHAIENTERELDQWRDEQLQKNRDFWDEYRRQVENFSACRIRTLQYEYTIKQMQTENILKRLRKAKYLSEHVDQIQQNLIPNDFIDFIRQEDFQLFLLKNQQNAFSIDDKQEFAHYVEQLSCLDQFTFPDDTSQIINQ